RARDDGAVLVEDLRHSELAPNYARVLIHIWKSSSSVQPQASEGRSLKRRDRSVWGQRSSP
ncbi:MAG TPA: hypothetical protein VER33_09315, partial [Polyangiaceae bacterium]|nr:hypothetical protein [Polyangiaceae bacterium]